MTAIEQAVDITRFLSALSRRAWDEKRIAAYAQTLVDSRLPLEHLGRTARAIVGELDADDVTPARLIAEAKQHVPDLPALPPPEDETLYHPGEGIGGNRPAVVMPDAASRAKLRAQYARMAEQTRIALDRQKASRTREAIVSQIGVWLERWLRGGRSCDWCRAPLRTRADLEPYLEFCMSLGRLRPTGTPMPEPRVFCADCAPGAISELIDGIRYVPGRAA